jgi:predicted methyltransferase
MNLTFEDLYESCGRCGGEGMLTEKGDPASSSMTIESTATLAMCPICNGKGGKITPTGEALRKFFKHLRRTGEI